MTICLSAELDKEIGVIVRDVAVGVHIVEFEVHGQVVLGVRDDIFAVFQEARELKLQVAVSDDAVEDALSSG